jgi:hypothetical protein
MFPHLEAQVRAGRRIPHSKDSLSFVMVQYSKKIHAINNKSHARVKRYDQNPLEAWGGIHQMFLQFFSDFSTIFLRLFPARIFRLFRAKS